MADPVAAATETAKGAAKSAFGIAAKLYKPLAFASLALIVVGLGGIGPAFTAASAGFGKAAATVTPWFTSAKTAVAGLVTAAPALA